MADILAACVKQTYISDPRHLEEEQTQEEEEEEEEEEEGSGTKRDATEVTQEITPEVTREVTPKAGPPSALLPGKETVSPVPLVVIQHPLYISYLVENIRSSKIYSYQVRTIW